jgi:hypothetical protein
VFIWESVDLQFVSATSIVRKRAQKTVFLESDSATCTAMNAGCSAGWILSSHAKGQSTNACSPVFVLSLLALETRVFYNRKPARCQPTRVLGVTRMRDRRLF